MSTQTTPGSAAADLASAVASNPVWYHTIDLPEGVSTPGQIDLRKDAAKILPSSLKGRSALDVGAFDGFWSFQMERRGAEVTAIDVDKIESAEWPPAARSRLELTATDLNIELGKGFRLASEALRSNVRRVVCNVYDLNPRAIGGEVDFAFCGALLLHLRNPVAALERIRESIKPGGELRLLEPVSPWLTFTNPRSPVGSFQAHASDFNWWVPNVAGLAGWLHTAGFVDVDRITFVRPPAEGRMKRQTYAAFSARKPS